MTISIPTDYEKFISDQVQKGRFTDAQAVVLKALSVMQEADIIDAADDEGLRRAVQLGIQDLENGRSELWDPQAIKREGRRILQERSAKKA
jgi:putative addiction module CopG family antidote